MNFLNNLSPLDATVFIFRDTLKILKKYPMLALPLFISWIIYGGITLYFAYDFNWQNLSTSTILGISFLIIFVFCFFFSVGSLILLELLQQIDAVRKTNIFKALDEVFRKDLLKALPIILVWAIIWFVLELIDALTRKKDDKESNTTEKTYKNITKTLSGYHTLSLRALTLDLIKSGVRMIVFYIYPAIAWEDETTINAIKKGFVGIKHNLSEFITGLLTIEFVAYFIFLPSSIMIYIADEFDINYSDTTWVCLIIYIACAFSLYLYLQQMYTAILYLWNMKWQKETQNAALEGKDVPKLRDIKMPDLLDDIPGLIFYCNM